MLDRQHLHCQAYLRAELVSTTRRVAREQIVVKFSRQIVHITGETQQSIFAIRELHGIVCTVAVLRVQADEQRRRQMQKSVVNTLT